MISRASFLENLERIQERIALACDRYGRNQEEVCLLPVTKNWPVDAVAHCQSAGIERVGENRVQEARAKQEQISGVQWDLIGHLQSNKINQVVGNFARIQTVDSVKLIKKLQIAAENKGQKCDIFLQVNAGNDPAKYGFMVDEVADALDQVLESPSLNIEGLMTIAPFAPEDPQVAQSCFQRLAKLRDSLQNSHHLSLQHLSMGMSDDLESAIAEGSTMIRVGSALFGTRD